jgi:hypothetical protein
MKPIKLPFGLNENNIPVYLADLRWRMEWLLALILCKKK